MAKPLTEEELIYRALMTGVGDYVNKNSFPACCWGCRAESTRRWCLPSASTPWAPSACTR